MKVEPRHVRPPRNRQSACCASDRRSRHVGPAADLARQARHRATCQAAHLRDLPLGRRAGTPDRRSSWHRARRRPATRGREGAAPPRARIRRGGALLCDKATRGTSAPSKLTLEFLILTAARSGVVPTTMALTLTVTHHAALHCDGKAEGTRDAEPRWGGAVAGHDFGGADAGVLLASLRRTSGGLRRLRASSRRLAMG